MLNFEKFVSELNNKVQVYIKYKQNSFLMKVISFILFFNKSFMSTYVTTIGSNVYFPSAEDTKNKQAESLVTLSHEFVHVNDNKKLNFLYLISYLFPQILSLLSIGAIFNIWFLLFLIFLLPMPAPFRMMLELRGYKMTLYTMYLYYKYLNLPKEKIEEDLNKNIDIISDTYFKGPAYYFMWPFGVKNSLIKFTNELYQGNVKGEIYDMIKEAFEKSKVITL